MYMGTIGRNNDRNEADWRTTRKQKSHYVVESLVYLTPGYPCTFGITMYAEVSAISKPCR